MATTHQRRPDGKAPDARTLVEPRDRAALESQLQKLDEQQRILEQRGESEGGLDAEVAARLQPSMGNAAIAGLLNRATDTASAQSGDTALEEAQEEEKEDEGEEKEAGEIEHVLPSFSTGGGGGGGGSPPWAMGRMLGGDDDDEIEAIEVIAAGWRPMPTMPDPDEDGELEAGGDDENADEPDAIDLREANAALGDAPWRPAVLARGLRHPRLLGRRAFGPEALVDASGLDHALGRARAMLRFVALHGDGLDAVLLARAAVGSGEPVFPPAAGFAGATARALALVEVALASLPPGWGAVLDVAVDPRARARIENVAVVVAEAGGLSATALFEAVGGQPIEAADVELVLGGHPAALAALAAAARPDPLPLVDLWVRPPARAGAERDLQVDALDAVLARFTGAAEPDGPGISHPDVAALFESMNLLLGAIGAVLVEVASAGVAVAPYVDPRRIAGVLDQTERVLRRAARRLYSGGEALEALLGTEDEERVHGLSVDTLGVRSTADLARQSALATFAGFLLDSEPQPPDLPDLYARAEAEALAGRAASARSLLDAAIVSAPPELEGRMLLAGGGLLLRLGFPEAGQLAEAAERLGSGVLAAGARSLSAGLALAREHWGAAEVDAQAGLRLGAAFGLPYVVADAACTRATAVARRGGDWRAGLVEAAGWLREHDEGGALNLLKARWAELAAG
jgi:hypothetical protein